MPLSPPVLLLAAALALALALVMVMGIKADMEGRGVMPPPKGEEKRNEDRARCVECAEDRRDVRPPKPGTGGCD
jgi:hypothetical protein